MSGAAAIVTATTTREDGNVMTEQTLDGPLVEGRVYELRQDEAGRWVTIDRSDDDEWTSRNSRSVVS
jgi:hypothetical protein